MGRWIWVLLASCAAHTEPVVLHDETTAAEDLRPKHRATRPFVGQSPLLEPPSNSLLATCLAENTGPGDYVIVIDGDGKLVRPEPEDQESFLQCLGTTDLGGAFVMSVRIQLDGFGRVPRAIGGLSDNDVRQVIANTSFSRCVFESMARSSPNGAGLLSFKVNRDGTPHEARIVGSHFQDTLFEACLVEVVESATFPKRSETTAVMFPLQFTVGK